jgi:hypothetical protein
MRWFKYEAPCVIISLTGSLLWGLNYAHYLLSRGKTDIRIILVDTWRIPEGRIYPAPFLARYLEVKPVGEPWHDDPYHEYFAFGGIPANAVLGSVSLASVTGKEISILLPGFNYLDKGERFHWSLERFQTGGWPQAVFAVLEMIPANGAAVTDDDIDAARLTAAKFLNDFDTDIHFQISMMFLSLRKRDWNKDAWVKIEGVFGGMWPWFNTLTCPDIMLLTWWVKCLHPVTLSVQVQELRDRSKDA